MISFYHYSSIHNYCVLERRQYYHVVVNHDVINIDFNRHLKNHLST